MKAKVLFCSLAVLFVLLLADTAAAKQICYNIDETQYCVEETDGHCWHIDQGFVPSYDYSFSSSVQNVDEGSEHYDYAVPAGAGFSLSNIGTYNIHCIDGSTTVENMIFRLLVDGVPVQDNGIITVDGKACGADVTMKQGTANYFSYALDNPGIHEFELQVNADLIVRNWHTVERFRVLVVTIDYNLSSEAPLISFIRGIDDVQESVEKDFVWTLTNTSQNSLLLKNAEVTECRHPLKECAFDSTSIPEEGLIVPAGGEAGFLLTVKSDAPAISPFSIPVSVRLTMADLYGFMETTSAVEIEPVDVTVNFDVVQSGYSPYAKVGSVYLEAGTYYVQFCSQTQNINDSLANFMLREYNKKEITAQAGFHGVADCSAPVFQGETLGALNEGVTTPAGEEDIIDSVDKFTLTEAKLLQWRYWGNVGVGELYEADWVRIGRSFDTTGVNGNPPTYYVTGLVDIDRDMDGEQTEVVMGMQEKLSSEPENAGITFNSTDGEKVLGPFSPSVNAGLPFYELLNIEFIYPEASGISNYYAEGPFISAGDGRTSITLENDGYVKLYTTAAGHREGIEGASADITLLWDWREKYMVKVFAGLEDACYGRKGQVGFAGEDVMPKVRYRWDWDLTGETGGVDINACSSGNPDYMYCDATQFTQMLLQRLHRLEEIGSEGGISEDYADEIDSLSHFTAYLMHDGFSEDFRNDFDNYMVQINPTTPTFYSGSTDSHIWRDYILDTQRLVFAADGQESTAVPEAGLYSVDLEFEFAPGLFYAFEDSTGINAKITVRMTKITGPAYDNLLYYLPINADLGYNRVSGELQREGYGTVYTGMLDSDIVIYAAGNQRFTPMPSDIQGSQPLAILEIRQPEEADYFEYVQITKPGTMLEITKTGGNEYRLSYTPSYATMVAGKAEKNQNTETFAGLFCKQLTGGRLSEKQSHRERQFRGGNAGAITTSHFSTSCLTRGQTA
jgi:hypothetical protein